MNDWHLITRAKNGTVSILKNLTEAEARQAAQRLPPRFRSGEQPQHSWQQGVSDGSIVQIEVLGPAPFEIWPGHQCWPGMSF